MSRGKLLKTAQDRPIPIETVQDDKTKFDAIRDNIEILWRRINKLRIDEKIYTGPSPSRPIETPIQKPSPPVYLPKYFYGYTPNGGTSISISGNDLTITEEVKKDDIFAHSDDSAEVTIGQDGEFEIVSDSGFNVDTDTIIEVAIYRDTGSGYSEVSGTKVYAGA